MPFTDTESHKAITQALDKLLTKEASTKEALERAERAEGKGWDPRRCNKLRADLESLNRRIERALNLLEG